jgi:hypothetical protein
MTNAARTTLQMADWNRDDSGLSIRDIEKRQAYKFEPHAFAPTKKLAWLRCKHCGLLTLRNQLTDWCIRMGCNAADHPEYATKLKRTKAR